MINVKRLVSTCPGYDFPVPPPLTTGLTSFLYMIPGLFSLMNNRYEIYIWTTLSAASFLSDYVMIQKNSKWHITDRIISKSVILFKIIRAVQMKMYAAVLLTVVSLLSPSLFFLHKAQTATSRDKWCKNWLKWHTYSASAAVSLIMFEKIYKKYRPNILNEHN